MSEMEDKNFNIRVSAKTKELAEAIQKEVAERTGERKTFGALVGELVYKKAKEIGAVWWKAFLRQYHLASSLGTSEKWR